MEEHVRDRSLDDFLNELKTGAQGAGQKPPGNYTDPLKEYNSINLQPDLVNTIEVLKITVDQNTKRISQLEEGQHTFMGHITELNHRVDVAPNQGGQDVIQKVENFMSYFVAKVDEKISIAEKKMEMERNRLMLDTEKRLSQAPTPAVQAPSPSYANHSAPVQNHGQPEQQRPADFIHETNRKVEALSDRMKLTDDLLIRYIDKQDKQYKKLKKGAVPKWLYWLNIFLLAGILLFLIQHFLSNYKIVVRPETRSTTETTVPSTYAEQQHVPGPLLPVQRPAVHKGRRWNIAKRSGLSGNQMNYASIVKRNHPAVPTKLKETTVYLAIDE